MASGTIRGVALLPIRPQYANSIMEGKKKVEFRKVRFRDEISHVVVYASSPVQKILGYFHVSHIEENTPKKLWMRYRNVGGILHNEFFDYYASTSRGIAIGIGRVSVLRKPLSLKTLGGMQTVPQSFAYISRETFERILECS